MAVRRFLPLLLAVTVVAGCATDDGSTPVASPATTAPTTTTSTELTTTTSTAPAPTTTTAPEPTTATAPPAPAPPSPEPPPADPTLRAGDRGPEVRRLQERLSELGFWLGTPDGNFGGLTTQAVLAFQKANGLGRDAVAGPATLGALEQGGRPSARSTSGRALEIDLTRQILLVVEGGAVRAVFNTSTGTAATPTPPGRFTVQRRIDGIRRAPLGDLYRPAYFNAGIAVHGSPSIPGHPASHGCARVHDAVMDHLWAIGAVNVGTPVHVY